MLLFLWLLSLNDSLFFVLHTCVLGGCYSLKHRSWTNVVFLKQNLAIWCILLRANLIKVVKTKFQFCRLNRPNFALRKNFKEGRDNTQAIPGQKLKGIYPTTTLFMILHILALYTNTKCM